MQKTSVQSELIRTQLEMGEYNGQRKHISQMEKFEIDGLFKRLKNVNRWGIIGHALDRLREKRINAKYEDIVSVINNSSIVEYKIDYNSVANRYEERVILRANAIVNGQYNMHVVYSLTREKIITVWLNHVNDFHATLDWNIYNADMKVFGV